MFNFEARPIVVPSFLSDGRRRCLLHENRRRASLPRGTNDYCARAFLRIPDRHVPDEIGSCGYDSTASGARHRHCEMPKFAHFVNLVYTASMDVISAGRLITSFTKRSNSI